jgi:hypothetical protein
VPPVFIKVREGNNYQIIWTIGSKLERITKKGYFNLFNYRYIFRLTNGSSSPGCDSSEIDLISFYVGIKEEYLQWSDKYHDDFEYFDSIGVNWCSFYKQLN